MRAVSEDLSAVWGLFNRYSLACVFATTSFLKTHETIRIMIQVGHNAINEFEQLVSHGATPTAVILTEISPLSDVAFPAFQTGTLLTLTSVVIGAIEVALSHLYIRRHITQPQMLTRIREPFFGTERPEGLSVIRPSQRDLTPLYFQAIARLASLLFATMLHFFLVFGASHIISNQLSPALDRSELLAQAFSKHFYDPTREFDSLRQQFDVKWMRSVPLVFGLILFFATLGITLWDANCAKNPGDKIRRITPRALASTLSRCFTEPDPTEDLYLQRFGYR
jgi:hypothetical protein